MSGAACPLRFDCRLHLHAGSGRQGRAFCVATVVCGSVFVSIQYSGPLRLGDAPREAVKKVFSPPIRALSVCSDIGQQLLADYNPDGRHIFVSRLALLRYDRCS